MSKNKYYLSGSDWVISALDYMMKKATCSGNMSQVVFILGFAADHQLIEDSLRRFAKELPVLCGNIARAYNLAPYWRIPQNTKEDLDIKVSHVENPSGIRLLLEKSANRPFKNENEHISFNLIIAGKQAFLAMAFDHRLLDARGAEAFLNLFQQYLTESNAPHVLQDIRLSSPSGLSEWMKKFYAGRNVNRKFIALSGITPDSLPIPIGKNRGFGFKIITFDLKETELIYDNACREAGYLMEMPYLLANVIQAVSGLFKKRGLSVSSFLIPVSVDMRAGKDIKQELFFNHVSYLFFQISSGNMDNLKGLINSIKQQMYEQVKSGFPKDLAEASFLTRIAPRPVLGRLLRLPFKGKTASFIFSHLGKSSYLSSEFIGEKVENIFHMPRVPVPPGLGFFFNYFNGQLNLVISYLEELIQDDEVAMLETDIKKRLAQVKHNE
ncbi:MAG: hypothetical protein HZB81_01575 [Deltaproteobacteria bacterium]|nr:hypothetical protein [Deltaproteobacteria bacterium]